MKKLLITLLFAITLFIPINSLYANEFSTFTMPFENDPVTSTVTSFRTGDLSYGDDLEGLYLDIHHDDKHILDDGEYRSRLLIKDGLNRDILKTFYFDDYADYTTLETKGFDQTIFIPFEPLGGEPLPEDGVFMEFIIYHDISNVEDQFMTAYIDQVEYDLANESQGTAVRSSGDTPTNESIYFASDAGHLGRLTTDLTIEWYSAFSEIKDNPYDDSLGADDGYATHIEPIPGTTDIIVGTNKGVILRMANDASIVWHYNINKLGYDTGSTVLQSFIDAPHIADISINNFGEIYIGVNQGRPQPFETDTNTDSFVIRINAHGTGLDTYRFDRGEYNHISAVAASDTRVYVTTQWQEDINKFSRTLTPDDTRVWPFSTIALKTYDDSLYYIGYDGTPLDSASDDVVYGNLDSPFEVENINNAKTMTNEGYFPVYANINIDGGFGYFDATWSDESVSMATINSDTMEFLSSDRILNIQYKYSSTVDNSGRYYSTDTGEWDNDIFRYTFTFQKDNTSYDFNEPDEITVIAFQYTGEASVPDIQDPVAAPDAFNNLLTRLGLNDTAGRVVMYTVLSLLILFVVIGANLGRVVGLIGLLGLTGLFMAANLIPLWVTVVMFVLITFGFITLKGVMQNE